MLSWLNDKIYKMKNETFNNYINSFLFEDLILKDEILQQQSFFMEHANSERLK